MSTTELPSFTSVKQHCSPKTFFKINKCEKFVRTRLPGLLPQNSTLQTLQDTTLKKSQQYGFLNKTWKKTISVNMPAHMREISRPYT